MNNFYESNNYLLKVLRERVESLDDLHYYVDSDDLLSLLHHIDDTIREVKEIEESEDMTYRCPGCETAQYDTGSNRIVYGVAMSVCGKCAPKFDKPKKRKAKCRKE